MRRGRDQGYTLGTRIRARTSRCCHQLVVWWMEDAVSKILHLRCLQHSYLQTFCSSLSVALCRAMLMKVDLLLLDEPTNHLDRNSVEWLQRCKLLPLRQRMPQDSRLISFDSRPLRPNPDHFHDRLPRQWVPRCRLHQHCPLPKEAACLLPRKPRHVSILADFLLR